jgi:hypothetical protein
LNSIYQALNGDLYSSYSQTLNTGGTYFKKSGNYPWQRIDAGLGLDVTSYRSHQYFAETSVGKVFMIQMYDERIYWADTSLVANNIPEFESDQQLFYYPTLVETGSSFEVKVLAGYDCQSIAILDLSGKVISSSKDAETVLAPSTGGIYLLAVNINNNRYVKKLRVFRNLAFRNVS